MLWRRLQKIVSENATAVADYKNGKTNALQFLVGKLLCETKGTANPQTARLCIKKLIEADRGS